MWQDAAQSERKHESIFTHLSSPRDLHVDILHMSEHSFAEQPTGKVIAMYCVQMIQFEKVTPKQLTKQVAIQMYLKVNACSNTQSHSQVCQSRHAENWKSAGSLMIQFEKR